jgi:RimJ/RimL family protein N-acetyltransferase
VSGGVEVLRTDRLVLRCLVEADAPFILELVNEPGWIANIGDRGIGDLDAARGYVEGSIASYAANGYGLWLMVLKATGEPIGLCGLIKREGLEHADIGYAVLEQFSGRGYAREAAAAVLDHARRVIGLGTVLAITAPSNAASIAVLERIGFRAAGTIRLPGHESESAYFTT